MTEAIIATLVFGIMVYVGWGLEYDPRFVRRFLARLAYLSVILGFAWITGLISWEGALGWVERAIQMRQGQ